MINRSKVLWVIAGTVALLFLIFGLNWERYALADMVRSPSELSPGFTYQGYLQERGLPADGIYNFSFEIFDAEVGGESWGVLEVTHVEVVNGIFTVILEFDPEVFRGEDRWLEIGVDPEGGGEYIILEGRQPITPTPYALHAVQAERAGDADTVDGFHGAALEESAEINADIAAHAAIPDAHHSPVTEADVWTWINKGHGYGFDADMVDGMHASDLEVNYQNVVIVAMSGGDYTSVQAAIDSITNASGTNPYLVWVAPGFYLEDVTMKPHVHLQGSGQEATIIVSPAGSGTWLPTSATVWLSSDCSLRDLTVGNLGAGERNVAVMATGGVSGTLVADVTVRTEGAGEFNYGIFLTGSGTEVTFEGVTAEGKNGSIANYGLYIHDGPITTLQGGSYSGLGGTITSGIYCTGAGTMLDAENVSALGKNGADTNEGLSNNSGAEVSLRGGSFTGMGGLTTNGISNEDSNTTLMAESVTALAENGTNGNYGLYNWDGPTATLRGGSFTGNGGSSSEGIRTGLEGTNLDARYVTALGENGTFNNYGVYNYYMSTATLFESSFTGRGGMFANGILNQNISTTLVTEGVTALGENASDENIGLNNQTLAAATINGGSFTGFGGEMAVGINNETFAALDAKNISTLAEGGSYKTAGLFNMDGAAAVLINSDFTAYTGEGYYTYGINNTDINTTLKAENIIALGENGSDTNYGLKNENDATAVIKGSTFTASGGYESRGLFNDSELNAVNTSALGQEATFMNKGLHNQGNASLEGGSYTGIEGTGPFGGGAYGIISYGTSATLTADNIIALGKNGAENYGLYNASNSIAHLHGGSFLGQGGTNSRGISNSGSGADLFAENVTIKGANGTNNNIGLSNTIDATSNITLSHVQGSSYSIYLSDGSINLSLTRISGNITPGVSCTAVTSGTTFPFGCP